MAINLGFYLVFFFMNSPERVAVNQLLITAGADPETPAAYFDGLSGKELSDFCRRVCDTFSVAYPSSEYPDEESLPPGVLELFGQAWDAVIPEE